MKDTELDRIRATVDANIEAGKERFAGLQSWEIGRYNGAIMFGGNDEAFPSQEVWSAWVD